MPITFTNYLYIPERTFAVDSLLTKASAGILHG